MRLFILFFTFFVFNSCDRIIEQNQFNNEQSNYTSPYQGSWYGVYNGGNFTIKVFKAGNLEVIRNYESNSETFYGQVYDSGVLNSVYSTNSGFTLNGSLSTKNGTWKQNSSTGNWTATKQ
jgi:hypothetical protein